MRALERESRSKNVIFTGIKFDTLQEGFAKLHKFIRETSDDKITVSGLRTLQSQATKRLLHPAIA